MYSTEKDKPNIFLSWQFVTVKLLALAALTIWLDKPAGTMEGRIAFEESGFQNYTYKVGTNKVYAIAVGPRGSAEEERGVWIDSIGHYKITGLPVGEYQLKVRAPGFTTEYKSGLLVEEAKTTTVSDVRMTVLAPSISVASAKRVWTTKDAPNFWINASGCIGTKIKIYRKDLLALHNTPKQLTDAGYELSENLAFSRTNYSTSAPVLNPFEAEKPLKTFEKQLEQDYEDSARAHFQFDKPLPPGDYVVEAEGYPAVGKTKSNDLSWFSVSDLGLIVMRAPEKTVVRAINLTTLKPVKGATISSKDFYFAKKHHYPDLLTDANGFATIKPFTFGWNDGPDSPNNTDNANATLNHRPNTSTLFVTAQMGTSHAYDDMSYFAQVGQRYTTYIYTERPVYRLGQRVFFKGIVRENMTGGLKNDGAGMKMKVSITDSENDELWGGELKTSAHGTFSGMCDVPADGHTGAYTITITYDDNSNAYGAFEIAQYKKPEYLVEVTPTQPQFISGDKMKMKVHATYFFGGPVANARVHYTVYQNSDDSLRYHLSDRPEYYSFFDDWVGGRSYSADYAGEFVCDGYAQTDVAGDALVEVATKAPEGDPEKDPTTTAFNDKRYKVEAEVTDISRMTVLGNASATGVSGQFELFVEPESFIANTGENIKVKMRAVDYDGKPVANQNIKLLLTRMTPEKGDYTAPNLKKVAEVAATTGADGTAHAEIPCEQWPSDIFYLTGIAKDSNKHTIVDNTSVWISNYNYPYIADQAQAEAQTVSIKMNKPVYKPGETARLVITAPVTGKEGVQAIFSLQGEKLYNYQVVNMDATAKVVEFPIKDEYAPNIFASVVLVDGKGKYYAQEEIVKVSPENHFLKLAVDTDKKKYHPGDKVTYTIKATHVDGTPAPNTEVSLGVVDESIYSIRPETAEEITKAFYSQRENKVLTSCSFPEEYSGGPDKTDVSSPKIRKNFKDLAEWKPALITDSKGVAQTTVTLPDNLTTWRATVRGISMQNDVGSAVQKVMCTQDLILRIALPRFFCEGDEGLLTAIVHNYSDREQKVKLTLNASAEFSTDTPLQQTLDLMPEKAGRFSWPVKVLAAGKGKVMVKAIGQTASDAMEQQIPINTFGVETFASSSGLISNDSGSVTIPSGLSTKAVRSTADYKVELSSSTLGPVLGNFNKLINYPYGCTEQTMSRMVPSIVAMQLHTKLGQPLTAANIALFDKTNKMALDKLKTYHHTDGGWGWWQNDDSNLNLTSLVVNGMLLLQDAGYTPNADFIPEGKKYLESQSATMYAQLSETNHVEDWISGTNRVALAKTFYILSRLKDKTPRAAVAYFSKRVKTLSPEAVEYMCLACKAVGDNDSAQLFYNRLIELANIGPETTDWEHTVSMMRKFAKIDTSDYTYEYTGVETTALGLRCVLAVDPDNTARIEGIKRWLMLHRDQNGWENTKTTAEVFLVLMEDELMARAKGATGNFTAHVTLSDKVVADFVANANNLYESQKQYTLPIPKKPTDLKIDKSGPGRLYWTTLMTYFRTLEHGEDIGYKGMPQGLKITRKFFRLKAAATTSDGVTHFHSEEIKDGQIQAGETILMKVLVESPISLPYVCLEAALPSGAEVVEGSAMESTAAAAEAEDAAATTDKNADSMQGDWGVPWWTHQDVLDDRVVYFGTELPAAKCEFTTLIRMELPGKVGVNPVNLYGMYTDKVKAYSNINQLVVKE